MFCISKKYFILLLILIIFTSILLISQANKTQKTTDSHASEENAPAEIIGGSDAKKGEFPFYSILFDWEDFWKKNKTDIDLNHHYDFNGFFFCGGTLISPGWVLTAAHCVETYINNYYYPDHFDNRFPTLGVAINLYKENGFLEDDPTGKNTFFKVKEIYVSPKYTIYSHIVESGNCVHDIALLKLEKTVKNTSIALLPSSSNDNYYQVETNNTIVGLGISNLKELSSPNNLQKIVIPVVLHSSWTCSDDFLLGWPEENDKKNISQSVCEGDSGGPVLYATNNNVIKQQYVLTGIVSRSISSCSSPGIQTKVTTYVDWIKRIITGKPSCSDFVAYYFPYLPFKSVCEKTGNKFGLSCKFSNNICVETSKK